MAEPRRADEGTAAGEASRRRLVAARKQALVAIAASCVSAEWAFAAEATVVTGLAADVFAFGLWQALPFGVVAGEEQSAAGGAVFSAAPAALEELQSHSRTEVAAIVALAFVSSSGVFGLSVASPEAEAAAEAEAEAAAEAEAEAEAAAEAEAEAGPGSGSEAGIFCFCAVVFA